jgi:carbamoyltransferase
MIILGLTGGFHFGSCDASATLMRDGIILSAVEEERLSRVKHSFGIPPSRCVKAVLDSNGLTIHDVDIVTLYVESYPGAAKEMREHLEALFGYCPQIKMVHHHECHAASSYYAAGWSEATVVTFDWSGDGVSSSIWKGKDGKLGRLEFIPRPNSLGVFYAAFTLFLGFERGDEYKVMGLASYGDPNVDLSVAMDVSKPIYELNQDILNTKNRSMHQLVFSDVLRQLFPDYLRSRYGKLEQKHMDMAASVQYYFETAVINFIKYAIQKTGIKNVCIAGGGGLNCTANGKLKCDDMIGEVFIPPFPNDAGCSFGGAAVVASSNGDQVEPLKTAQLGPEYTNEQIAEDIKLLHCKAEYVDDIAGVVAQKVSKGSLAGWHQGRLEIGPRALGGRSILADPREKSVKDRINKYVKFRETFRPFAPSVLESESKNFFDLDQASPYMSFVAPVLTPEALPGITHVNGTARVQTVSPDQGVYADLLRAMEVETGYPVILNTSFNYMGQPIVCTPKEAIYTFFGTGLDLLAVGNWLISKK